jgi:hypothetical protein
MVSGAERPHFISLAVFRMLGDVGRGGSSHASLFFDELEIFGTSKARPDGPDSAAFEHGVHFLSVEAELPSAAHSGGYGSSQRIGQSFLNSEDIFNAKSRAERTHTAGNIETDTACGDNASGIRVEGCDAADREAVAPVRVRHGVGCADDAGKPGDI